MKADVEEHIGPAWAAPVLSAGAVVFGALIRLRRAAYEAGLLPIERAERPVISVGNLAVGGTGKTPFVIALAQRLAGRGLRAAILSRGYGGTASSSGGARIVSRGEGSLMDAKEAGDEPVLLAQRTRAPVVIARRRIEAAEIAVRELGAEVLILDDGFQHLGLARELDIVLIDRDQARGSGHLLPRGRLREPPAALSRAHLVVLIGGSCSELEDAIGRTPVVEVEVAPTVVRGLDRSEERPAITLSEKRVALLAAIARPHRFEAMVESLGAEVVHRAFHRDHARFDREVLDRFRATARARGAEVLLTTEKDAVRIPHDSSQGMDALCIEHRILQGESILEAELDRIVEAARRGERREP
jgi:tetraacyldisaccharide 4'-kinase